MFWSYVPQLRRHVVKQAVFTWVVIAAMAALFWFQPAAVRVVHDALFGSGFVPVAYEERVLAQYFSYGWLALAVAWVSLEVGGFMLVWRYKAKPHEYPAFRARLEQLAREAGLRTPTLVVLRTNNKEPARPKGMSRVLNAAATQSLLTGTKIAIIGDIVETLSDTEGEYVTAHELSHIKHRDILAGVFIGAGNTAFAIQKWAILTSAAYDLITFGWRTLIYLASTWAVLWTAHLAYKLLGAAHSRSREYMADVGAVKIAGWDGRVALITGLARIHHELTRWRPFRIFKRSGTLFSTHPDIEDRARALKLDPIVLPDGNVQVGHVVIAA